MAAKALVATAVALALAGGGYLADNAVRDAAEQQAAARLQAELKLSETPEIQLGGFPFSLTLLTRAVPEVTAHAATVPIDIAGKRVELNDLTVRAEQLVLSDATVTVGEVEATATLGYAALSTIAGVPITPADGGRLQVTYTIELFGRSLQVGVGAKPVLDVADQQVDLTQPSLQVQDVVFDLDAEDLIRQVVKPIDLSLDYGLKVTALVPAADGIDLRIAGSDLKLTAGG